MAALLWAIQLLTEASNAGSKMYCFCLSALFAKVFTMAGITKYAELLVTQSESPAAH
jgi:hypothetical protein